MFCNILFFIMNPLNYESINNLIKFKVVFADFPSGLITFECLKH